mmetsp:Transcript_6582/g.19943  ORF Transcript_6582/g.19943 Transcript_6582/m.19943 type:complete len:182 (-) Transcript_6582:179-724(-)
MSHEPVVGIDFSGNPTKGSFIDYLEVFQFLRAYQMPYTLHIGEVLNDTEAMLMLDNYPQRVGHAVAMGAHVADRLRKSDITTEVCLSSNVVSGLASNYKTHALSDWIHSGRNIALCTDDPGLFSTSSSREHFLAASELDLSPPQITRLVKSAARSIFMRDEVDAIMSDINKFNAADDVHCR